MNEVNAALMTRLNVPAITNLLAGTTSTHPIAIYHQQATEGAPLPYIVFSSTGTDDNLSRNRTKQLVIFVRAYSGSSAAQAGSIDAQIDAALHLVPLTVSGWTDFWLARETDLETVQLEPSGRRIWMEGGMYRERLHKT
jgi:hypothetical protein